MTEEESRRKREDEERKARKEMRYLKGKLGMKGKIMYTGR